MFQKRIFYGFLILIFLGGCVTSHPDSSTTSAKEAKGTKTHLDGSKNVDGPFNEFFEREC